MVNTSFSGIPRAGSSDLAGHATAGAKTIILGMTAVVLGLGTFYSHLHRKQAKKDMRGTNAHHEQRLAYAGSNDRPFVTSRQASFEDRIVPLSPIKREQDNGHSTIQKYLQRPDATQEKRFMQPAPQRGRRDDIGKPYTKSPDYADSYEKTPKHFQGADKMDVANVSAKGTAY